MSIDLDGAAVLLTGASAGIGASLAPMLAERGARLALVGRRAERLGEVAQRCRLAGADDVTTWPCELSDVDAAGALARAADERLGGVDVVINNAGSPLRRAVQDLTVADVEGNLRVNLLAPVAITLALLPGMLERRRGSIVNVSSLGGRLGIRGEPGYCAAKFALCGWSESIAADLHGTGVEVRLILPGAIDTEIWDRPGNEPAFYDGPLEPPATVAAGIVAAIEGDAVEHYLPDLRAVVEYKTSDLDGFLAGMVASAQDTGEPR